MEPFYKFFIVDSHLTEERTEEESDVYDFTFGDFVIA